jgi:hypothetical protein
MAHSGKKLCKVHRLRTTRITIQGKISEVGFIQDGFTVNLADFKHNYRRIYG